jgi:hypothetical protein
MRITLIIFLLISLVPCVTAEAYFEINDITMTLINSDAIFKLNYTLDSFAKLYVLALGTGYIEPDLMSLFKGYNDAKIIRADPNSATMLVKRAGKSYKGYYLFDSQPLGVRVDKFTVIYPGGLSRSFHNITSTPNVFCSTD